MKKDLRSPNGRRRLPDLYSIDEIAGAFGLSRDTITRRVQEGEFGRVIRFGDGRVRVRLSEIERFLERHSGSESPSVVSLANVSEG